MALNMETVQNNVEKIVNDQNQQNEVEKKKKRALGKGVDPSEFNGPKKSKSSYMLFGDDIREEATAIVKAECEKTSTPYKFTMIMKKIGDMWKALEQAKKVVYESKSKELHEKYTAELEMWKTTNDYRQYVKVSAQHKKKQSDKKNVKAAKASGMPKKPMAGYMIFSGELREQIRNDLESKGQKFSISAAAAIVKPKWAALGEEGHKKYHDKFAAAKQKYEEDMKEWFETEGGKLFSENKEKAVKKRNRDRCLGKKAKRVKKDTTDEHDECEDEEDDEEIVADVELSSPEESVEDIAEEQEDTAPVETA